ncbi:MAG: phosphatidate cytidylyltransferase, partial [Clostridia bacterium]|nr:phosphatidate cytidylyltransferase [Clostridia bacterium]
MKKRFITGIGYVVVMAALLVMKLLIPVSEKGLSFGSLGVDALFWLIAIIGSFEFTRAFDYKSKHTFVTAEGEEGQPAKAGTGVSKAQRWVTIITCALMVPAFVTSKMVAISVGKEAYSGEISLVLLLAIGSIGGMVVASLAVFDNSKSSLDSTAYCELCLLYVGALTSVGANINHFMINSSVAILLLFILVPAVDTWAFFFGKIFGKLLPYKLAPKVSPNKTIVGSVGGILGGIFAAVIVWLICEFSPAVGFTYSGKLPSIVTDSYPHL